jgi:hypothetical protein
MPAYSAGYTPEARSRRDTPHSPPLPDLFGHVNPSEPGRTRANPGRHRLAEWPARPAAVSERSGTVRPTASPDRPPASASGPVRLSGSYTRTGATLRRADGLALVVCQSHKPALGPRDSGRYVRLALPGGGRPPHLGNLYGDARPPDDLDGCEFQDGPGGTRYALRLDGPGAYTVAPVGRRPRAGVRT